MYTSLKLEKKAWEVNLAQSVIKYDIPKTTKALEVLEVLCTNQVKYFIYNTDLGQAL